MKIARYAQSIVLAALLVAGFGVMQGQTNSPAALRSTGPNGILTREQTTNLLPDKVFYRGQSATVQTRNSGAVQFPGGKLMLAAVVDTSGYSTAIAQSYQAYLITEVPLNVAGHNLAPGCYGFGFVAGDKMELMDVGANVLFEAATKKDAQLKRPNPLQIVADASGAQHYRLYMGRTYVELAPGTGK